MWYENICLLKGRWFMWFQLILEEGRSIRLSCYLKDINTVTLYLMFLDWFLIISRHIFNRSFTVLFPPPSLPPNSSVQFILKSYSDKKTLFYLITRKHRFLIVNLLYIYIFFPPSLWEIIPAMHNQGTLWHYFIFMQRHIETESV